jgi:hypothetical protein
MENQLEKLEEVSENNNNVGAGNTAPTPKSSDELGFTKDGKIVYQGGFALVRLNEDIEKWSPIPKNMRHEATVKLGSYNLNIASKDTFRALTPLLEKILLPTFVGLQPNENGWVQKVFEYWCDWEYYPTAKGITLDYRTYKQEVVYDNVKYTIDMPNNVDDYINYHMIVNHPKVAKTQDEIDMNTFDCEIIDLEKERVANNQKYLLEEKVLLAFTQLVSDIQANRNTIKFALNLLKGREDDYDETTMGDIELKRTLKLKMEKPFIKEGDKLVSEFLDVVQDTNLKNRAFLNKCVEYSLVIMEGNSYFYKNERLGGSEREAIAKLSDPKFSSSLLTLREALTNKIKQLV